MYCSNKKRDLFERLVRSLRAKERKALVGLMGIREDFKAPGVDWKENLAIIEKARHDPWGFFAALREIPRD